jgi:hypothetical protein
VSARVRCADCGADGHQMCERKVPLRKRFPDGAVRLEVFLPGRTIKLEGPADGARGRLLLALFRSIDEASLAAAAEILELDVGRPVVGPKKVGQ